MVKSKGKVIDEVHLPRMIPACVLRLARQRINGTEPRFIMAKTLTKADLDAGQNRLLIPAGFVRAHLIPFLSDEERAAANLLDNERKRKKPSTGRDEEDDHLLQGRRETKKMKPAGVQEPGGGETTSKKINKKEAGRKHEGLGVAVYAGACMWKAYVTLTRWDASNGTILKGDEYSRYLARWSGIQVGDEVELWGFREGESTGRPCFVLHKTKEEEATEPAQRGGASCV